MPEMIDPARETRIINGLVDLAHRRTQPEDGSFSLFGELPNKPEIYPGQALPEYFVPARPATREELLKEGANFCPNFVHLLAESEADTKHLETFTGYVNAGYRVNQLTNHRAIPDVAVAKAIQALSLSQPQYLGDSYFEKSYLSIAKPVAFFQYGEVTEKTKDGFERTRPRSAVEVILMFSGVELVLPGTLTVKDSVYIDEDDRKLVNAPIKEHRERMQEQGGLIIDSAGSASEDWRMVGPDGETLIIQQNISKGTMADLMGAKTVVLPTAVVFDRTWKAKIWTGDFIEVTNDDMAHAVMYLIARQAEILSGEKTRYVNDHETLEQLSKFRSGIDELSDEELTQFSNLVAKLDNEAKNVAAE